MKKLPRVSAAQAAKLGHYVYVYYDSTTRVPFYIGRGQSDRVLSHAKGSHNDEVRERIELGDYGLDILVYGLDHETAKKVESAAIDLLGIESLHNKSRGAGATKYGRTNLQTLLQSLEDKELTEIRDNLIVVSIRETYLKFGDDPEALHESTRGVWAGISSEKANKAQYIAGVVDRRIVYVMKIAGWFPAGSTSYFMRDIPPSDRIELGDRIEFVGRVAEEEVQDRYLGKRIDANQRPTYFGPFHGKTHLKDNVWS